MNKICAIVILYNFDENVILNIDTYAKYVDKVFLIDNSDNITFYESLKEKIEKYDYQYMGENKGIATALNYGMSLAQKEHFEFVLTMDQDSSFDNNLIENYFHTLRDEDINNIAIISPNYFFDRKNNKVYKGFKDIYYTMQSGNLVNMKIFNKLGPFKDDFFIDGVDYEYCIRAKKCKYRIVECGEAILNHHPAITKKFLFIKYGYCSTTRLYYQIRNLLWIYKEYNCLKMRLITFMKYWKIILLFDNKKEYLKMYKKGKKDFLQNKYGKVDEIDE